MTGKPAYFELGVQDTAKAQRFYGELFGWDFKAFGTGAQIETGGMPGGMHGGDAGARPYLFFEVEDMAAALEQVRSLGGTVYDEDIEGDSEQQATTGRFVLCGDDQGSHFGLHEPPRPR
jgi:predicted enzyme related to lactoylglutathione lyase